MRTSVVQFAAGTDLAVNLEAITRLVGRASVAGAELVVLPEAAMHDFGPSDMPLGPVAQPLDGPFIDAVSDLAKGNGVTIVVGMFETSPDPQRPFNTVVVVGGGRGLLASYRKAHLYDSFGYRESERLLAGDSAPVVVEVGERKVGLMTCYDLRFPEHSRTLVDAAADTLVVPAAWVRGALKEDHWTTLLRARAIENTAYVVGAGQCGDHYVGCSMLVDPMGVAVARLGDEEGVATADLSAERLAEVRRHNPSLANRRTADVR